MSHWDTIMKVNAILVYNTNTNNLANIRPYRVVRIEISLKHFLLFKKNVLRCKCGIPLPRKVKIMNSHVVLVTILT